MNLRPGIDTPPPKHFVLAKLNAPFDDRKRMIAALQAIEAVQRDAINEQREHEGQRVVEGWALNVLVAFGLRFFRGPLEERGAEEPVPNFPPGGVFTTRYGTRFGLDKRQVPLYLRTMAAAADDVFVSRRLAKELGREPSAEETSAAYRKWLAECESDLVLYIEGNHHYLVTDLWDRLLKEAVRPHGLELACPVDESYGSEDGRDLIGWFDPISNMDDLIQTDPAYYRSKIYLPHPAPGYPGEAETNRDELRYNGGTYLVHRKYVEDLDKWRSDDFAITDNFGRTWHGEEARARGLGRDRKTGRVVCGSSGRLLEKEFDSAEAHLAPLDSHILQVRGGNPAPFKGPFPPLKPGETNVFHIQDVRIRRRGGNWRSVDPKTGEVTYGLHFFSFQNNIQQTGFEFIQNIWLLNPLFRLNHDHLLDPDKGIAEPVAGGYYFVPPEHRDYPGEVFFE